MKKIETLFGRWGNLQYAGEGVTQLEHALQTATLAQEAQASDFLTTAAFLHDIGHMLNRQGETPSMQGIDDRHQYFAAYFLKDYFSESVFEPIRLHVEAKRALCHSDTFYFDSLSDDSKRSLKLQGGALNVVEFKTFLALPYAQDALSLRRWDDLAKVPGKSTKGLNFFLEIAESISTSRRNDT